MLKVGSTGKLSGVVCKVLVHIKTYKGFSGFNRKLQLLEFDTFTGWNWKGSSAPTAMILYNLDSDKYYHWYDISSTGFVSDSDSSPETLRSGGIGSIQTRKGCNCIHCGEENQWTETNMTNNRFMCFSCRSTDKWRYEGQFI